MGLINDDLTLLRYFAFHIGERAEWSALVELTPELCCLTVNRGRYRSCQVTWSNFSGVEVPRWCKKRQDDPISQP